MRNLEQIIRAKAADLGAKLPAFRMHEAPELFAGWSDRIALADSLRAAGKPHLDAVAEADRHLGHAKGVGTADPLGGPRSAIAPLSDWLGDLARLLGADIEIAALSFEGSSPRTPQAAVAAPMT